MKTSLGLTRRRFLRDLTVVAGATALGSVATRRASADSKMVLGTWGGDYSKLLTQNVETPLLKPKGIEVVHDIAGDSQRRAKLIAEQRLPRAPPIFRRSARPDRARCSTPASWRRSTTPRSPMRRICWRR